MDQNNKNNKKPGRPGFLLFLLFWSIDNKLLSRRLSRRRTGAAPDHIPDPPRKLKKLESTGSRSFQESYCGYHTIILPRRQGGRTRFS